MLQRRTSSNGVVYYASAKLEAIGVRHAFSTRIGGISPAPFDSLNLGNPNDCPVQDDYQRIWANYGKLLASVGCDPRPPLRVHQVHGCNVALVETGRNFDTATQADALVSRDSERAISVRTADCVPVLISTVDGRTVAAVHAGWRGIVAGVIPTAINQLLGDEDSAQSDSLLAAIGPCIGPGAFEVGQDVLDAFCILFADAPPIERLKNGKGKVDLRKAARIQLLRCGLRDQNVDSTDRCTVEHREEFFSHRREHGATGRMAAVIAPNRL